MPNTVVGLYRTEEDVRRVVDDLTNHGFSRTEINHHDDVGPELRDWLTDQGVPETEAEDYVLGVRNGGKLVTLDASDDRAAEAVDIMQRHERRTAGTGLGAGTSADAAAKKGARTTTDTASTGKKKKTSGRGDETIEVVEEDLEVGTRQVDTGGVRVRSYVTEHPVEKQVKVRDESVHVDRRPADRPVSGSEAEGAFQERSFEVDATKEEVVANKRARVVEEVVLHKDVDEHTETVRDTVRRTDVDVEGAEGRYKADRDHYRKHHGETFATSDRQFDDFEPAYRYGVDLASHPDYSGRKWDDIAPAAREHWEARNAGTWDEFEGAVRYGYERAPGERR